MSAPEQHISALVAELSQHGRSLVIVVFDAPSTSPNWLRRKDLEIKLGRDLQDARAGDYETSCENSTERWHIYSVSDIAVAVQTLAEGLARRGFRGDIAGIFIPDLIKVDLSTGPVRVAGSGPDHPVNPDDAGYSRLGVFGGDTLQSAIQDPFGNGGMIPGGWPNGRRFGDDVVDIAVSALISDLRGPLVIRVADGIDGVSKNDSGYNKVFPYAGTPHNGRNHTHP